MTKNVTLAAKVFQRLSAEEKIELAGVLLEIEPLAFEEFLEDIHDTRILKKRNGESTRPFEDFVKDLKEEGKL